ncbi:MAG: trypsin-like peptidase domain-containing protein [Kiritimatiellia bacterium]
MKNNISNGQKLILFVSISIFAACLIFCLDQYASKSSENGNEISETSPVQALIDIDVLNVLLEESKASIDSDADIRDYILKRAEQGDVDAQVKFGIMCFNGDKVPQNYVEAARWYKKAADQGDASAQFNLGILYALGQGVPKDNDKGIGYLRQAGDQGNADIQYQIGRICHTGKNIWPHIEEAAYWYEKAALQGHVTAQFSLGIFYSMGMGVETNFKEAARWFKTPAEQGNVDAQETLGNIYFDGQDVAQDFVAAAHWYEKAAKQGAVTSQRKLGAMYYGGKGIVKDLVMAVHWLRKAADQGDPLAQACLGSMYYNGEGVVKDSEQAYIWSLIAYARGVTHANTFIELCETDPYLTKEDIRDARIIARQWQPVIEDDTIKTGPFPAYIDPNDYMLPEEKELATGSGFVISSDGYFLTCAHVIKDARKIRVFIKDNTYNAKIISADINNDVALIKLDGAIFKPLPLKWSLPEMGDSVFTIGFPNLQIQGMAPKYTDGVISSLSGIRDDIRTMQITVPIQGGNSGGALVDKNGNAVGIVVAQLNAKTVFEYTGKIPQNVNFAVKINYALPLIQSVSGLNDRLPQSAKTKALANPSKEVGAATGLVAVYN